MATPFSKNKSALLRTQPRYYRKELAKANWYKTITQESSYDDPVRGPMTWRSRMRIVDGNKVEYELYLIPGAGKEEKMMVMTLARKQ
jgi:hypothetical protein